MYWCFPPFVATRRSRAQAGGGGGKGGLVGSLGASGGVLAEGSRCFVTFGIAAAESQVERDVDFRVTATICDPFLFLEMRPGAAHFFFEISVVFFVFPLRKRTKSISVCLCFSYVLHRIVKITNFIMCVCL